MVSDTFRTVIVTMGGYIPSIRAQFLLERYCADNAIALENFSTVDLPQFILFLANGRDTFMDVTDQRFCCLLNDLVKAARIDCGEARAHSARIAAEV